MVTLPKGPRILDARRAKGGSPLCEGAKECLVGRSSKLRICGTFKSIQWGIYARAGGCEGGYGGGVGGSMACVRLA